MGDAMIIQPFFFSLLFYGILLYVGVDFTISGMLLQSKGTTPLINPKLLGLRIIKFNQKFFERMRNQNKIYRMIYSFQNIKFFTLIAGILITIGSLIQIIGTLLQLWL